jgi:hypothetical protein
MTGPVEGCRILEITNDAFNTSDARGSPDHHPDWLATHQQPFDNHPTKQPARAHDQIHGSLLNP